MEAEQVEAPDFDAPPSSGPPPMPMRFKMPNETEEEETSPQDIDEQRQPPPIPTRKPPPIPSRKPPPVPEQKNEDETPSRAPPPMPQPPLAVTEEIPSRAPPPMPQPPLAVTEETPSRAPPPMPPAIPLSSGEDSETARHITTEVSLEATKFEDAKTISSRRPPPMPTKEEKRTDDGLPNISPAPPPSIKIARRPVSSRVKERQAAMFGEKKDVTKTKIEISGGGVAARLAALKAQAEKDKAEHQIHTPVVAGSGGGVKERLASLKLGGFDAEKLAARAGGRPMMGMMSQRPPSGDLSDDIKANLMAKKSRIESQLNQARVRGGDDVDELEQELILVEDEISALVAIEEAKKAQTNDEIATSVEENHAGENDIQQIQRVVVKPGRRKKTVKRMVPGESLVQAVEPLPETSTPPTRGTPLSNVVESNTVEDDERLPETPATVIASPPPPMPSSMTSSPPPMPSSMTSSPPPIPIETTSSPPPTAPLEQPVTSPPLDEDSSVKPKKDLKLSPSAPPQVVTAPAPAPIQPVAPDFVKSNTLRPSPPPSAATLPTVNQEPEKKKGGGLFRGLRKSVANKTGVRGVISGKSKAPLPQKKALSVEEAAQIVEALGGNFVAIATKMREARIDTKFLNSLHGTELEETLVDLGATDRLSRRRLIYELKLDAAES
eukprot:CAMPEP_0197307996 /NCGR_PEP_ID=MMETSP0891-20130614/6140_1 /TAXON_ID=44058 ORGANISM="Aureoumbra lagunensis, Strain CCMP1510" /NCGR_SAMPLE_ID=MMETSP0891 /ASSEMBLY_ACC=CAM_ASM_000534 /LENGTH=665 /DNA_ID=CAMNT_0042791963 /DNA_START=41 /DNA_END=2038 /DNA_ORIENTATION=+